PRSGQVLRSIQSSTSDNDPSGYCLQGSFGGGAERDCSTRQARISFLIDGQPFLGEEIVNAGGAFERLDAREALVLLGRSRREPGGSEPHRVLAQIGRHAGTALGRGNEGPHTRRSGRGEQ